MNQLRTAKIITAVSVFFLALFLLVPAEAKRHPRKKSHPASSRIHAERESKEKTLARLQQEIAKYESELREHEKREKHSKETILAFEQRTKSLKARIARLESEAEELQGEKTEVDRSLHQTSTTLDTLKDAYAKSSRQLYMHGSLEARDADRMLVASPTMLAPSADDPVRMSYYASVIARAHALDRARLDSMKEALGMSSNELATTIESEHEQIGAHREEAMTLETKKAAEAKQLLQIQARKERLRKLLAERKASEKKLETMIASLLKREGSARRTTKNRHRTAPEFESERELGPARGPHSLDWPSASHRILQGYGEHRNAELNTVTMNLGIDIAAPAGSAVKAAAEGEVALVSTLPSYGTIVVIHHAGGLHTVYADLASASVRQGTHVRAGSTIGRSGSNEESGAALHFEVWKGKSKQNPVGWLK